MLGSFQAGLLGAGGATGDPSMLFKNSEVGVWFEPRLATLYQDSAGTTPVTTTGQPVGKWLDLSGNNIHAIQGTSGNRPTYEVDANGIPYICFDGSNDYLSFGSLGGGLLRACWLIGKLRGTNSGIILELSPLSIAYLGAFYIDREFGSPYSLTVSQLGDTWLNLAYVADEQLSTLATYRVEMDRQTSNDYTTQRKVWKNGSASTLTPQYNYTCYQIPFCDIAHYLGARSGSISPSALDLYGLILVNQIHNDHIKTAIDNYWMEKIS